MIVQNLVIIINHRIIFLIVIYYLFNLINIGSYFFNYHLQFKIVFINSIQPYLINNLIDLIYFMQMNFVFSLVAKIFHLIILNHY